MGKGKGGVVKGEKINLRVGIAFVISCMQTSIPEKTQDIPGCCTAARNHVQFAATDCQLLGANAEGLHGWAYADRSEHHPGKPRRLSLNRPDWTGTKVVIAGL